MKIDVVTIFPALIDAGVTAGVIGRARSRQVLDIAVRDLRDFTHDRHRSVDDIPFGGGPGMVLTPAPLFAAVEAIAAERGQPSAVVLLSPAGKPFRQSDARRLAALPHLVLLCGRYEGVDERVREHLASEEVSIGDYVLSGGEVPALVVLDAVGRLVPGVVGDETSVEDESFTRGLLDYPHYTRPAEFRGLQVPEVLSSGHHSEIRRWRREQSVRRTAERRPELLATAELTAEEREYLRGLRYAGHEPRGASARGNDQGSE